MTQENLHQVQVHPKRRGQDGRSGVVSQVRLRPGAGGRGTEGPSFWDFQGGQRPGVLCEASRVSDPAGAPEPTAPTALSALRALSGAPGGEPPRFSARWLQPLRPRAAAMSRFFLCLHELPAMLSSHLLAALSTCETEKRPSPAHAPAEISAEGDVRLDASPQKGELLL